jgi:hypothetical protein
VVVADILQQETVMVGILMQSSTWRQHDSCKAPIKKWLGWSFVNEYEILNIPVMEKNDPLSC